VILNSSCCTCCTFKPTTFTHRPTDVQSTPSIAASHTISKSVHESNSNNPLLELSNHRIYNINTLQSEVPYSVQTNYPNSLNPSLHHNIGMPSTVSTYHSSDIYQQSSTNHTNILNNTVSI